MNLFGAIHAAVFSFAMHLMLAGTLLAAATTKPAAPPSAKAAPARPKPASVPQRNDLLAAAFAGPLSDASEIVYVARSLYEDGHWYANFGYWSQDAGKKMWAPGGARLIKKNLRTGQTTDLLNDPEGSVRDPVVHYDGKKILFAYRKAGTQYFHLHEINTDGTGLRELTSGNFDDFEPTYLPNGDIVFVSSRCKRWVSCWFTQVAVLHRCDPSGQNIRSISGNIEHDNTPAVMPDGRLLYTRWEYIDRSQVEFHHLWSVNPDGTNVQTWFGNMHPGILMIDAKPIAGTTKAAAIFSPGHGVKEHQGPLYVVTPEAGPDTKEAAVAIPTPGFVHDPVPLSETQFIVARKNDILLVNAAAERGNGDIGPAYQVLASDAQELHEPIVIRPRKREPIVPDRADLSRENGRLILADVHLGRNMAGVKPGEIKKLLVLEALPKPVNFSGGPEPLTWLGTFNLERVLGTVPVEPDGSAYFELPPHRALFLVALDEKEMSVKRMQSFFSVMPGETTSCVGCHEQRSQTGTFVHSANLSALQKPPQKIQRFEGIPEVIDYPRDIQPIWDQHCVKCHSYDKPDGGVVLSGDRGQMYSHSYWMLYASRQIADGANGYGNRDPRTIGTSASALMKKIDGSHYGAKLDAKQWRAVWVWVETGATYSGTYAALGSGMVGHPPLSFPSPKAPPVKDRLLAAYQKKCSSCHINQHLRDREPGKVVLPATPSGKRPGDAAFQRVVRENDPILHRSTHVLFNYSRPEKSIVLLAPLAKEAGGWGSCAAAAKSAAVFAGTDDADYQAILAVIREHAAALQRIKRFDMPGFLPNASYVREMIRYGILPENFDREKTPVDVHAIDQAYWQSLWWKLK